jgi:hypothetical protein
MFSLDIHTGFLVDDHDFSQTSRSHSNFNPCANSNCASNWFCKASRHEEPPQSGLSIRPGQNVLYHMLPAQVSMESPSRLIHDSRCSTDVQTTRVMLNLCKSDVATRTLSYNTDTYISRLNDPFLLPPCISSFYPTSSASLLSLWPSISHKTTS